MKQNKILRRVAKVLAVARVIYQEMGIHHSLWYMLIATIKGLGRLINDSYLILYSTVRRKPLIHVIGDSHAMTFRRNKPFVAHHIGAATAHNLKKKDTSTHSNEKLFDTIDRIRMKDIVILLFGEIDCRIHAYYQFRKNDEKNTISEILDMTIANYGEVMEQIRELGINPSIHSISPATTVGNEYNFPYYADPEVRCEITRMFNEKLEAFCNRNGYPYIDVYSKVCDENGLMLEEYAADSIHLNTRVVELAKTELREKLGIKL